MALETFPNLAVEYDFVEEVSYDDVIVSLYPNGREQRIRTVSASRRCFNLRFRLLSTSDMDGLYSFFMARHGSLEPFYFTNPRDSQTYIVRFNNSTMSRTLFTVLLESTGLSLIEVIGES
jgi:uncharacterized protein (TIGR02217 family)